MAVPAAFQLDSDMSVEDLRAFISARPSPPQTARSERLSSAKRNELQDYLKRTQSQGSLSARTSSARTLREATPSQFVSPGLLAHTSLERMAKLEGPYRLKKREISRLAECCHLLECLSVKYFDQEVESIKEELFKCIFDNYDELCTVQRPRARGAFLDASPFFQLYEQEQQKNENLQREMDSLKIKNQDLQFMNKGLKDRLKAATSGREEEQSNGGAPGAPPGGRRSSVSQQPRPSSSQIHARPPQVPELPVPRVSTASSSPTLRSHRPIASGSGSSRGIASVGGSWKSSNLDAHFPPTDATVLQKPTHAQKSPPLSVRSHRGLEVSERDGSKNKLSDAGGMPVDSSKMKDNPFFTAARGAQMMVTKIKDFEDFLDFYRNPGGEEGGIASVFSTHHKRRKHDHEARWHDFALYLSRHPECCIPSKQALKIAYHEWREGMGYKAPFSAMLRALIRHDQLKETGIGDEDIEISETIGHELDPSSDEEEDVEHLVQERDAQLLALRTSLAEAEKLRKSAEELHGQQLHDRSTTLEKHHENVLKTAERNHANQVKELEERLMELTRERDSLQSELDAEIAKQHEMEAQHLAELKEQLKQEQLANKRLHMNEKELMEEVAKGLNHIKDLQGKLDQGSAQRAEMKKQLTDKHNLLAARMVEECVKRHADELRETAAVYETQLEILRDATRGPVKVSERRFETMMDLVQTLQASVLNCIEEDPNLEETDSTLHEMTRRAFAHTLQHLMEHMHVDSKYDTDSEEEYTDPAIGPTMDHTTQTNIAPVDLGIAVEPGSDKRGKGKAKGPKASKASKRKQSGVVPPPISTEEISAMHKVIDTVYEQKRAREAALADGKLESIPWFVMRFWLGKFGSIELSQQEAARVKELVCSLVCAVADALFQRRFACGWRSCTRH